MTKTTMTAGALVLLALFACKKKEVSETENQPTSSATASAVPAATASAAAAGSLAGSYRIESASNPDGGSYSGKVTLSDDQGVTKVAWSLADGSTYGGVGLTRGNLLGVGWGLGSDYGVVVYRVDGGKLDGRWATAKTTGVGTEVLEGPSGLDGTYKIVAASNPGGGGGYTGSVEIRPQGDNYAIEWSLPGQSFSGVGRLHGSVFVVGWGSDGKPAGVVVYEQKGGKLDGKWAQPKGSATGTEVLAKG